MDIFTVLNYQGSKKNLLEFIHTNLDQYIDDSDTILDIFAGTSSVAYSYKRTNRVFANDSEPYAATISRALLGTALSLNEITEIEQLINSYKNPINKYDKWIEDEDNYIKDMDVEALIDLYNTIPTVWNGSSKYFKTKSEYSLFVKYYSTSYFGIRQARDIDAIKYAIDHSNSSHKDALLSSLFYAMKECVFSKDGHMAQPLDLRKNGNRLIKQRRKSIKKAFIEKCKDYTTNEFVAPVGTNNSVFNCNFEDLICGEKLSDVSVIYADPPYTDMQYSRYYHLLNTVLEYDYPDMTINQGEHTKGLYLNNRFQSQLSKKATCLDSMEKLVEFSKNNNILLAISFAYPQDTKNQKTDRYVMNIDDLIDMCKKHYSNSKVKVKKHAYEHSNNRNSETKKVLEYLIICERD
jgi:adenine-specific DNA methylase